MLSPSRAKPERNSARSLSATAIPAGGTGLIAAPRQTETNKDNTIFIEVERHYFIADAEPAILISLVPSRRGLCGNGICCFCFCLAAAFWLNRGLRPHASGTIAIS